MNRGARRGLRSGLLASLLLFPLAPVSLAITQCDTDPQAVDFEPTVSAELLNDLLAALGTQQFAFGAGANLVVDGVCVDHRIGLDAEVLAVPLDGAPFLVTPNPGQLRVDLTLPGPFAFGVEAASYAAINCNSTCVVELPYVGEIFNGCNVESAIAGPVFSLLQAAVSFGQATVTQRADTCVLGDCTAVHPLEDSSVSLSNFQVSVTGGFTCEVCIDLPDPLPDPPCLDPCGSVDDLLGLLLEPIIEGGLGQVFVTPQGSGILIDAFHSPIVTDFGCFPIAEVVACQEMQQQPALAGLARRRPASGWNSVFYLLPLAVAAGLLIRLRRPRG